MNALWAHEAARGEAPLSLNDDPSVTLCPKVIDDGADAIVLN